MSKLKKIIVILGQTATGKSNLAVKIAKLLPPPHFGKSQSTPPQAGGEIISADSRQVYKGLNLGTGKITKREMQGVPHYLLDVANPKNKFTVVKYKNLTDKKIKEIIARGKIPIICGGTGFYIDAVVNNIIFPEVPPNEKLRKILNKKNILELFKILKKLDKDRAEDIKNKNEINNKVRLIRAIEIAKALGKVPNLQNLQNDTNSAGAENVSSKYEFIKIGLTLPAHILKERINIRLLSRIKMGMIREAEKLHKQGLSWKRMKELGLEYRYVAFYLQKKISKEQMIEKLNSEIYKYAKRQMTWFKRDKNIIWLNPSKKSEISKAEKLVKKFIK